MNNKKTGTSMGRIIITSKAIDKRKIQIKKSKERKERAKICLNCKSNEEGFCKKYSSWCGRVNYICLGIKNPYEYKMPQSNNKNSKKNKKKK